MFIGPPSCSTALLLTPVRQAAREYGIPVFVLVVEQGGFACRSTRHPLLEEVRARDAFRLRVAHAHVLLVDGSTLFDRFDHLVGPRLNWSAAAAIIIRVVLTRLLVVELVHRVPGTCCVIVADDLGILGRCRKPEAHSHRHHHTIIWVPDATQTGYCIFVNVALLQISMVAIRHSHREFDWLRRRDEVEWCSLLWILQS